jgi:hypothetical protein
MGILDNSFVGHRCLPEGEKSLDGLRKLRVLTCSLDLESEEWEPFPLSKRVTKWKETWILYLDVCL